jgi:hypothetical protein
MSQQQPSTTSRPQSVLRGFASLLSSAVTATGDSPESLSTPSTLSRLIDSTVSDDTDCCSLPCLMLKHSSSSSSSSTKSSLEDAAALYLARSLTLTRTELEAAPAALLENISESFMSLVDSRFRSSMVALLNQSQSHSESSVTRTIVGLLAATSDVSNRSCPISPSAVVTSFRVLPVCDRTQNGGHVAPLVMETVIDLNILSQRVTVTFVAPGTIQGSFSSSSDTACLLTNVVVVLDSVALLQSMMKQARSAVREAVIIASGVASNLLISPQDNTSTARGDACQPVPSHAKEHMTTENGEGASSAPEGAFSMQPPPPRLPGSRGGSTPDLPSEDAEPTKTSEKNTSWDDQGSTKRSGLSLLTAAANGLARDPVPKKQRLDRSSPPPRKETSCSSS